MAVESVSIWKSRIYEAKKLHQKVLDKTNDYALAYNGTFPDTMYGKYTENISQNYVFKVVQTAIANLLYRSPAFQLPPSVPDEYEYSSTVANFINRIVREANIESESQYALKDALIRGSGWMKVGYHQESSPSQEQIEADGETLIQMEIESFIQNQPVPAPKLEQDHEMHIRAIEAAIMDQPVEVMMPMITNFGLISVIKVIQHLEERRQLMAKKQKMGRVEWRVKPNQIWLRYVDFRDILIDPNATRWEDARWVAIRTVHNIKGLKRSQVYKMTSKIEGSDVNPHGGKEEQTETDITESHISPERLAQGLMPKKFKAEDREDPDDLNAELYEIWDKQTGMVLVICDQVDDFLRKDPSPYDDLPNFFPIVRLCFNEMVGSGLDDRLRPYGYSWISPWWPQQIELNKFISMRQDIAKRSLPRFVASSNVSKKFLERLARAEPGSITQLKDSGAGGVVPQQAVVPIAVPGVPIDIQTTIASLQDHIAFLSGFSEIQLTGMSTSRTATASALQNQAATAFAESILKQIERTLTEVGRIVMAIARQFYDEQRVVQIEGPYAGPQWTAFKDANLYGDMVEVIPGSTKPQVDSLKRAQWAEILQVLAQVGAPEEGKRLALFELLRSMGVAYPQMFLSPGAKFETEEVEEGQAPAPGGVPVTQSEAIQGVMPQGPEAVSKTMPVQIPPQRQI